MGKLAIEKWQCDRCGEVKDKYPYGRRERYDVTASVGYDNGGGKVIEWHEMCPACDAIVSDQLKEMTDRAAADRHQRGTADG